VTTRAAARLLALGALLEGAAQVTPARASGFDLFGFGARSSGLAGAGAALADGYDACYENPSGLAAAHTRRLTLGYYYGHFGLDVSGVSHAVDDANAVVLGGVVPLPLRGALRDRVALGFGFYSPIGLVTRAHVTEPDEPLFLVLEDRAQVVGVQLAAAVRILPQLDVGAGVLVLAALMGDVFISADSSGRIGARSEQQLVADFAPLVGVTAHLDVGDIALVYRGVSEAAYDVVISNDLVEQLPIGLPELRIHGVAQYDPRQVTLEGAWHTLPRVRVVTSITWRRWSDYPGLAQPPSRNSTPVRHADMSDTFTGRLAAERLLGEHAVLRLGYAYEPSPVGARPNALPTEIDNDRHVVAIGLGWTPMAGLHLDGFAQLQLLVRTAAAGGTVSVMGATVGVDLQ
jgi:long-chain fatty acid transport protein